MWLPDGRRDAVCGMCTDLVIKLPLCVVVLSSCATSSTNLIGLSAYFFRKTAYFLSEVDRAVGNSGPEPVDDVEPQLRRQAQRFDVDSLVVSVKAVRELTEADLGAEQARSIRRNAAATEESGIGPTCHHRWQNSGARVRHLNRIGQR